MKKLLDLLKEYENNRMYGEVIAKFENGKVVLIRKTESLKP